MTREQIERASDRGLDYLIAEHLFGYRRGRQLSAEQRGPFLNPCWDDAWFGLALSPGSVPNYSATGDGMLAVLARMQNEGFAYSLESDHRRTNWSARFEHYDGAATEAGFAFSLPGAVSRGALLAVLSRKEAA